MGAVGPRAGVRHHLGLRPCRVEIDFRAELTQDDRAVIVRCTLDRIGRSSIGTREEVRKEDGTISAEARSVVVARIRRRGARGPSPSPNASPWRRNGRPDDPGRSAVVRARKLLVPGAAVPCGQVRGPPLRLGPSRVGRSGNSDLTGSVSLPGHAGRARGRGRRGEAVGRPRRGRRRDRGLLGSGARHGSPGARVFPRTSRRGSA